MSCAGVSCGVLSPTSGLPRFEQTAFFRVVDDGVGEAVFHRAAGVARFGFDVELDVLGREAVDADNRGVADGIEDAVVFHGVSLWLD